MWTRPTAVLTIAVALAATTAMAAPPRDEPAPPPPRDEASAPEAADVPPPPGPDADVPPPPGPGGDVLPGSHRDGPGRAGGPRRRLEPLTDAQVKELLEALKAKRPHLYERLEGLRQRRPRDYRRTLRLAWHWHQRMKQMPPELQDAMADAEKHRTKIWRLSRQYHQSDNAEARRKLREQIAQSAAALFDVEQKLQEHRLKELAEQIKQIEKEMRERREQRLQIVSDRVEFWLGSDSPARPGARPSRHRGGPTSRPATRPAHGRRPT